MFRAAVLLACAALYMPASSCRSPEDFRAEADATAYDLIDRTRLVALGETEPFSIDRPEDALRRRLMLDQALARSFDASPSSDLLTPIEHWPDPAYLEPAPATDAPASGEAPVLGLFDALAVAAANSRAYQNQKESVYLTALALDLEADQFRDTWQGVLSTLVSMDLSSGDTVAGIANADSLSLSRRFQNGLEFTGLIAIDLVKLLTQGRDATAGITADFSVSIPLLRGSGAFVVREPLTQAERDMVYQIYTFERFKRTFAVSVASEYLSVLQTLDSVQNAADNYKRIIASTRRARRLAQAGELDEVQVDQSVQDELRARNSWISAQQSYQRALDNFKLTLGLPTDARIELDPRELTRLANLPRYARYITPDPTVVIADDDQVPPADADVTLVPPDPADAGPLELPETLAVDLALANRLDLRVDIGEIVDSQRGVAIAADNLRADLTLLGGASFGESRSIASATQDSGELRPDRGFYSLLFTLDLPLERTLERNQYRAALIGLERAVREAQLAEDQVKQQVRQGLRELLESRESVRIQAQAVRVAQRRVESANLFLQAGRAQIRDLLEAQDALVSAQDALTSAIVSYRIAELEIQRDMGVINVNEQGLWREYDPTKDSNNAPPPPLDPRTQSTPSTSAPSNAQFPAHSTG